MLCGQISPTPDRANWRITYPPRVRSRSISGQLNFKPKPQSAPEAGNTKGTNCTRNATSDRHTEWALQSLAALHIIKPLVSDVTQGWERWTRAANVLIVQRHGTKYLANGASACFIEAEQESERMHMPKSFYAVCAEAIEGSQARPAVRAMMHGRAEMMFHDKDWCNAGATNHAGRSSIDGEAGVYLVSYQKGGAIPERRGRPLFKTYEQAQGLHSVRCERRGAPVTHSTILSGYLRQGFDATLGQNSLKREPFSNHRRDRNFFH
nr:hypothetical protein CFP56_33701 [Quercus suber]